MGAQRSGHEGRIQPAAVDIARHRAALSPAPGLKKAGYDGIEVPILEGTPEYYRKVLPALRDSGLLCNVVTNMPGPEHNPLSPEKKQRALALDFMKKVIDCTQALESPLLCGPFYQPVGLFTGTGPTAEEKARAAEHARASAEYAARAALPSPWSS